MDNQVLKDVRQLTGLTENEVFDMVLEAGETYLKRHLNGDELAYKRLVNSGFFWNWWKGQWEIRDRWFLSLNKGLVCGAALPPATIRELQQKYLHFQNVELSQAHLVYGLMDIKVRYAGIAEMPTMWAIVQQVCWQMEVTKGGLLGKHRNKVVAEARHLAALLMREAGYSLKQIARTLKRKCHTTIMNSIGRAEDLLETDEQYFNIYNLIKSNLWQGAEVNEPQKSVSVR